MIPTICFAQDGQLTTERIARLDAGIDEFTRQAFDEPAATRWVIVPEGGGFTAARPSRTVIVSLRANRRLQSAERADLLDRLSRLCAARTGKAPGELVLSILDPEN